MLEAQSSFVGRFLSHFTYGQKFLLIGLLFACAIGVSLYSMIQAQNQAITLSENELRGEQYIRSIRKLLEAIPEHSLLSNRYLNGEIGIKSDLQSVQNSVNADFKNLISIDAELQKNLRTSPDDMQADGVNIARPSDIEKRWEELNRRQADTTVEVNAAQHALLNKDLIALLGYVGETSNQILDNELVSYYLLETALKPLPRTSALIPMIMIDSNKLIKQKDSTAAERDQLIGQLALLKSYNQTVRDTLDKVFLALRRSGTEQEISNKLRDPYKQYTDASDEFANFVETKILVNPQDAAQSELLLLGTKAVNSNLSLWDSVYDQADRIIYARINMLKREQMIWVAIALGAALLGFILGYIVLREITRPLIRLVKAAKQLAGGDLTTRIPVIYQDEVGQASNAFNLIAESFQELLGRLQWTGIQLTTSTTEIAAAAKQQEATVVEQEATTKEIAVTAREISSTAKEFAKTMNEVSGTAEQTSALAASGKAGLTRMESIMHQMVEASANIASKLGVLSEKAGNITTVITTINKVAEQTNLLSLNAAIEAEKAGEHGRSFAVIAREIRRLADQTGNATLDIEKMVNEIVSAVSAGVMGVDKFSEEIHTGVGQVSIVSEQLSKIIEQVQVLTTSFENVNQGMQTQSLSAEQINESITQLSDAAQQTTESIRQFHNAIEQLNNAAVEMQAAVSKMKR